MQGPLFHVVLVEPEIPNNTGAIGRTCIVTGCALHLVHPLGFDTSEKALRRAGLDYWARVDVRHHESWQAFLATENPRRLWLTSGKSGRPVWNADLRRGDYLVFGKETAGLADEILAAYAENTLTLPMLPNERGMNLANVATTVVYEGVRQCLDRGELSLDEAGRLR
jgi:tRNA (cytidine/uridine-2'-O-)-methyltransferase